MKILLRSHPKAFPSRGRQNARRTEDTIELRSRSSGFPRAESACARWERVPRSSEGAVERSAPAAGP